MAPEGTQNLGLWHIGTVGPRPQLEIASVSVEGIEPFLWGRGGQVVCLFFLLIHGHSDTGGRVGTVIEAP